MSPSEPSGTDGSDGSGKDTGVAKTAGVFVFSGIVMSILKALTPNNKPHPPPQPQPQLQPQTQLQEYQKPITHKSHDSPLAQTIEIVKGDTLWGLSRKYGVSIDAIKEANGLTGDTIYAGKKLVIP